MRSPRRCAAGTPHTDVRLGADRALPPALQDRFVPEADEAVPANPSRAVDVATSHVGNQVRPQALVDVLDGLRSPR